MAHFFEQIANFIRVPELNFSSKISKVRTHSPRAAVIAHACVCVPHRAQAIGRDLLRLGGWGMTLTSRSQSLPFKWSIKGLLGPR